MEVWKLVLTAVLYTYISYNLTRKSLDENVSKILPHRAERLRETINTLTGHRDQYLDSPSSGYFEQQKNRNSGVEIDEIDDTNYPIVPYKKTSIRAPRVTQSTRSRDGFGSRGGFGSRISTDQGSRDTRDNTAAYARRTSERRKYTGTIPSFTRPSHIPPRTF